MLIYTAAHSKCDCSSYCTYASSDFSDNVKHSLISACKTYKKILYAKGDKGQYPFSSIDVFT